MRDGSRSTRGRHSRVPRPPKGKNGGPPMPNEGRAPCEVDRDRTIVLDRDRVTFANPIRSLRETRGEKANAELCINVRGLRRHLALHERRQNVKVSFPRLVDISTIRKCTASGRAVWKITPPRQRWKEIPGDKEKILPGIFPIGVEALIIKTRRSYEYLEAC